MAIKEQRKKVKEAAKTTTKTTRELYSEFVANVPEEVIVQMPSVSAVGKMVRNQRKGNSPIAPSTLAELKLASVKTEADADFVMYDSGVHPVDRLIMFSTQEALDFLVTCDVLHMDGTVKTAPALFDQIYVIHGKYLHRMFFYFSIDETSSASVKILYLFFSKDLAMAGAYR